MSRDTEWIRGVRSTLRLYEMLLRAVCEKHGLMQIEGNIIGFLCVNPDLNTASDIAERRLLQKGNVSQGVELLIGKGLLKRQNDERDRRRIHLILTDKAEPVVKDLKEVGDAFESIVYKDMSKEEIEEYMAVSKKIHDNAIKELERKKISI